MPRGVARKLVLGLVKSEGFNQCLESRRIFFVHPAFVALPTLIIIKEGESLSFLEDIVLDFAEVGDSIVIFKPDEIASDGQPMAEEARKGTCLSALERGVIPCEINGVACVVANKETIVGGIFLVGVTIVFVFQTTYVDKFLEPLQIVVAD